MCKRTEAYRTQVRGSLIRLGFPLAKKLAHMNGSGASLDMDLISVIKLLMYAAPSYISSSKLGARNPISFDNGISVIRWQLSKYRSGILRLRTFSF